MPERHPSLGEGLRDHAAGEVGLVNDIAVYNEMAFPCCNYFTGEADNAGDTYRRVRFAGQRLDVYGRIEHHDVTALGVGSVYRSGDDAVTWLNGDSHAPSLRRDRVGVEPQVGEQECGQQCDHQSAADDQQSMPSSLPMPDGSALTRCTRVRVIGHCPTLPDVGHRGEARVLHQQSAVRAVGALVLPLRVLWTSQTPDLRAERRVWAGPAL
jgi:hypothetical protein